jgi:ornithine--oxo-acid transaminase
METSDNMSIEAKHILEHIAKIGEEEAIALTERYGTHNYHPLPVTIVRAKGVYAYDASGTEYIDCIGCYSAVANGHLSQVVCDAVRLQLDKLTLASRAVYTQELAAFLRELCEYTGMDMACPMNSGAEAVETAIKLARKWAYTVKGVEADMAEIIVAADNFHGRTTTIVGFSSEPNYRAGFGPFTPGFTMVPFGDIAALEATITDRTAAVLMEPIQAEGGVIFPPDGFMAATRRLCSDRNVLLIWDEIQTGFSRTGRRFAWQHEDAEPDMMCLGKALGGGVIPVSAVVGKKHVMQVFHPGDHGSTFGGNPVACVAALAALQEMEMEDLTERGAEMGRLLISGLRSLPHSCIEEVRGRGLLIGLEMVEGVDTDALTQAFLRNGILTKETRHRTFRFAPPLVITEGEVHEIVRRVSLSLDEIGPASPKAVAAKG